MKILMVASYLPYPLFSGGHIRLYNLLKQLKKNGHEVTLICEKRDFQSQSDIENVSKIVAIVITFPRKKQWSISNIIKSGFSANSFLSTGHRIPEMEKAIKTELENKKYDLIHIETFYVFQNVPKTELPTVLAEHNIEYLVYKRFADKSPVFAKPFILIDVAKIKREEKKWWKKATRLIAVSNEEKEIMKREDITVIPNGVDIDKYDIERKMKTKSDERKILFIGDFRWVQNRDAVEWIVKNVWPLLLDKAQKNQINIKLWVVGKRIPSYLKEMGDNSIFFDENAPLETEDIYREADLLLAPIRIGGGTSYKILESMATGLPVLTTFLGNEGINAKDGQDLVIAETPDEFVSRAFELLENSKQYEEISNNSRKFVKRNFDWKNISVKLEEVYKGVIK